MGLQKKRFPDGILKKFKAHFVVCGDRQVKGVDCFKTWAPIAHWSTVCMIMILEAKLNFCSAQCDITAAFIHAHLLDHEHIYVNQPKCFERQPLGNRHYCLKLNSSVYGICKAPRHFFKFFSACFEEYGLKLSDPDHCFFLRKDLIIVVYVNDLLVYARRDQDITTFVKKMKMEEVQLHCECTAEGFLGVDITRDGPFTTLTQPGLRD